MKEKTIKEILASVSLYDKIALDFYQTREKPWPVLYFIKPYLAEAKRIIDIGCGSGRLAELISLNQTYFGLDKSTELIKIAKTNYFTKKNINFQVGDIINPLKENDFDLALIIAVLHHLPTQQLRLQVLKNIHQALRPKSKIIITTWNLWQKDYRHYLFNYKLKLSKYKLWSLSDALIPWQKTELRYVHSFTKQELNKLLCQSGFKVKEIFYEYQGKPTSLFKGKNLVAVAEKC